MSVTDKLGTTELLFQSARQMGLAPAWLTAERVFAVTINGNEQYINLSRSPLNPHTSVSIAQDKYLTRLILARHHLPNIPFAMPRNLLEATTFLATHGTIIAKPVGGSGSKDIHIITDAAALQTLNIQKYILEKYIIGKEMRYLVLNDDVIAVHQSDYGSSVAEDRPLKRLSVAKQDWDATLVSSSIRTAQAIGLRFSAVDYLVDSSDHAYILEVNSTPGLKWFHAPTSGLSVDVARLFLEAIVTNNQQLVTDRQQFQATPLQANYSTL